MRKITLTAVLVVCLFGGALMAQYPEQRGRAEFTFDDAVQKVGNFSSRYYDGLSSRQQKGVFTISPDETKELQRQLNELMSVLKSFSNGAPIEPVELNKENIELLARALACVGCAGKMSASGSVRAIENQTQLQLLLLARCEAIQDLILRARDGRVDRDTVFAVEIHLSYLRQIAIAYLGTING